MLLAKSPKEYQFRQTNTSQLKLGVKGGKKQEMDKFVYYAPSGCNHENIVGLSHFILTPDQ